MAGGVRIGADGLVEVPRRDGKLHRHDFVLHHPASGAVRGEVGIFESEWHDGMLSDLRLRRFLQGDTVRGRVLSDHITKLRGYDASHYCEAVKSADFLAIVVFVHPYS